MINISINHGINEVRAHSLAGNRGESPPTLYQLSMNA